MESSGDMKAFRAIIHNLLSPDNLIRSRAEETFEKISASDKNVLLLNACNDDSLPMEEAVLSSVLLRRLLSTDFEEVYSKMLPDIQNQIKTQILLRIQQNINPSLRKKMGDVAAELARNYIDENGTNHWQEYLNFLFEGACSSDPVLREIVLLMFSAVPGVFGNQLSTYLSVIREMLLQTLSTEQPKEICYAAVKALSAFIIYNVKTSESDTEKLIYEIEDLYQEFKICIIPLLELFSRTLDFKDGEADEILRCLIDLVDYCLLFFKGHFDGLLQLCLKGLSNEENVTSTRQLSLEVIVTMFESSPIIMRQYGAKHLDNIINATLKMMTDLEEDPQWDFIDEDDRDDNTDSNSSVAEASLDRLACAMGGKFILNKAVVVIHRMLGSGRWEERYAGLMAISAIGEGCHKQMTSVLPDVVDGILPFLSDQCSRVRYAACNALGQLSTDFAPLFQKKFHEKVIISLLKLLSDSSNQRVQAHAGAALVNFFEDCPKKVLGPYMNQIVKTLEEVLSSKLKELVEKGTKLVLEQVIVTLASLADSSQEKFINYYDKFMPSLKFILQNTNQPHLLLLHGKTIECISLIGLAVGQEKFLPDANEVMELLLKSQSCPEIPVSDDGDDPILSYMITGWARFCKILGKGFEPYMKIVMGPVMKAAALKPEVAVLDSDEMKVVRCDDNWEFINLGEKHNFGIRTAGLDDKATACQMLVCYARELKESFADYVEETLHLMIPMLKFYFHDGVRVAAGEILPWLLESAKVRGENYLQDMWRFILPPLLEALDSEPEPEVLCEHMASFARCVDVLSCHCLSSEDLTTLIKILNKNLVAHLENSEERPKKRCSEDYEKYIEEEDLLLEDEEGVLILSKISEIVSTLFATYKQEFFVYFDVMLPHFVKLLEPKRSWQDHQWSLCVFSDLIEYCGPSSANYQQYFLTPILTSVTDPNPDLRQTAAYAIGVIAQHGGPIFSDFCASAFSLLIQMINSPESRSEENERATENAISSVTKIFMSNNPSVNAKEIIPVWITWLPIWDDEEEAKYVFNVLCTLLESNSSCLLGNDNSNLPRIVHIFAEAFHREAIEVKSELRNRVITLIRDIQTNSELFSLCVAHLAPNLQTALHTALTQ